MQSKVPSKQGNIIFSSQIVQQSTILTTVSNDNNFALFGFNHDLQQIQESVINITVGFNLYNGALICYQCDVQISNSVAVFIASGQFLSGLVFNSLLSIQLQNTTIQYRFQSQYSAGLAFNVSQDIETFILKSVTILGFNSIFTNQRLFVSQLNQQINITILQVQVCQNTTMSDTEIRYIILSNPVIYQCKSICEQNTYYVYGICATQTVNSEFMVSNGTFICIENALFDGQQCVCQENYVLNGYLCVSILLSLTNIYRRVDALTNVETDINSIYQLINDFNNSVVSELNSIAQNTLTMYNQSEAHLVNNISALNQKLNNNNDDLDQRIFSNVSALHQSIVQNSADMQQQINTTTQQLSNAISNTNNLINVSTNNLNKSLADINQSLSQNISQVNVNMLNVQGSLQTYILQNFTTLDQRLAFNITQKDIQIQQLTDSLAFVTSIVMNTVEQELWFECQQQLYTFKVFDLATATNAIQSSDFASGFAFDTQVIQNAFLDVQSISSSFTLFKTQSVFLNIKVQLNGVSFVSGAMLSPSQSIQINQLAVVSKVGTQVTINAGVVLSILQQTATVTNITNLLLNINMNPSSAGIISLINVVNGQLIVKGYQILGSYSSTNTISLGVCQIQGNSKVNLNYIQISPDLFMCGNLSSYLISYVNTTNIDISHVTINIGNISTYNTMSNIITTTTQFLSFGGILTYCNTSIIQVEDIQLNTYEQWDNKYINYTGHIFGFINKSISNMFMICAIQIVNSSINSQFYMFGLIGYFNSQLTIQLLSAQCQILPGTFTQTGIIGYVNGTKSLIMNVQIQFQMTINKGNFSGSLAGMLYASEQLIYNVSIIESQIEAHLLVGLMTAQVRNCKLTNIQIVSSQASGSTFNENQYSAGLIAVTEGYVQIIQCYISKIQIQSYSNLTWAISGGIFGDIYNTSMSIQQTQLLSSYISCNGSTQNSVNSGGLVGYQFDGQMNVIDTQIQLTNITAFSTNQQIFGTFCGTFAGFLIRQRIFLTNSKISSVQIQIGGQQKLFAGLILGVNWTIAYTANGISTDGINIINGGVIANCANVVTQSQSGC
ncbi:Hypothetical_protein [Hexamita inflata]|uniref:Hypothetical_protein n=1 Tax=Hexamita inflata TaxID=28002 RepID=A0AA86QYH1_9EUKA|nr:Hypothetical protein HINF_LOCUS49778 [Hexamita inflata]